jgi:hypothetical protein
MDTIFTAHRFQTDHHNTEVEKTLYYRSTESTQNYHQILLVCGTNSVKPYLSSLVDKFSNNIATTAPSTLVPPNNISRRVMDSTLSITTPYLEGEGRGGGGGREESSHFHIMIKLTYSDRCSSLELGLVMEAEGHLIFIVNHVNDLKPSMGLNLN